MGTATWSNPGNAAAGDSVYATANLGPAGQSHYLKATNFGFAIPGGSTITGILVIVTRKESASNGCKDNRVRIVKGGTIGATDRASATEWPTVAAAAEYGGDGLGGSTDLWGETWTVSDINASNFGVAISALGINGAQASIDFISITVFYS